ncbi:MAG TPA: carboxypeptidase-like regulatory domain-containing protein [Chitinophagales bacterium]|nr:carboxypeptidase-like regulatory domain-containing protein [Chitinophagales bacterium]
MQRLIFLAFLLITATIAGKAQNGMISGVIIDGKTAETLIGANVLIKEKAGTGSSTDIDGRYKIDDLEPGTYTVEISYISYDTKTVPGVEVKPGQVTSLDVTLTSGLMELTVVEVKARPRQESLNTVLAFQQKNIAPSEVISRDIITSTPDKNTGEVLKRMSGTTITDGKFVVIRGLSDRYNLALVNGNLLPSTEPDRKTFAFDLFPSAMLDNLIVIKAAQPNLPGDFAGGIIILNTRDIPDKPFISISAGAGYNTISTFKEYYTYTGGKTDWLGIDDGTRQLPAGFPVSQDLFDDLTTTEKANFAKQMAPWGAYAKASSPLDQSYQLSGGWVKKIGKVGEFGAIGALTYNNSNVSSFIKRNDFDNGTDSLYAYQDDQFKNNILWGGLLNLSWKLNDNTRFSFKNSYNINSSDITTMRSGVNFSRAQYVQNEYYEFNSNELFSTQISGDHYLTGSQVKLKWSLGMNTMKRDQPNYRSVNYAKNITPSFDGDTLFTISPSPFASPENLGIFYSYMDEQTYTAGLDITKPFKILGTKQSLGFGGSYLTKVRSFDARIMGVATANDIFFNPDYFNIVSLPIGELLQPANFSDSLFYLDEITNPSDAYTATQENKAIYLMIDNQIANKLRVVWGARAEFFNQTLQSFAYGFSSTPDTVEVDTKETDSVGLKFDFLPSINITYGVTAKTNIRVSAYKTVARPELRELAPFGYYDIETNSSIVGNPSLKATNIYNADVKAEHFFGAGQVISGGVFYKKFYDPIGQRFFFGTVRELKPINDSLATVVGAEFELRKNLGFISPKTKWLEQFTFNTNLAVLNSTTVLHIADTAIAGTAERDMQGQSDYVINAGFTYIQPEKGYSCTLLFNQIGRRISEYGNAQYDDIYENPRPLVDAQVSVPFNKGKGNVKLNMSDILNKDAVFYQDVDGDGNYVAEKDNAIRVIDNGAKISLSVNYTF